MNDYTSNACQVAWQNVLRSTVSEVAFVVGKAPQWSVFHLPRCNYMALRTRWTSVGERAVKRTYAGPQFENPDQYIKLIFSKKLFQICVQFYQENRLITELISVDINCIV